MNWINARVTPDMLSAFRNVINKRKSSTVFKCQYQHTLDQATEAAAKTHPDLKNASRTMLNDLKAALVAECVMRQIYDFANSYNSDPISNPNLYSRKHDAIRRTLAHLERGTFSLYDNEYATIVTEQNAELERASK